MAELDTTVAGRHADGSPYNADGALLVTITDDEPAPRGPTPSDGNYSFDGVLQFHDDAATLSTADYSTASFAETETLPDGQVVGKLGEHSVPIPRTNEKYYPPPVEDSEQTTAPAAATATAPVAPEPDGSVARDVLRGVSTGAVKAGNDLTGALSMILGAPSDITKSLLETFGVDAGEGILGSDNIEKNMNSFSSWVVENIPGVSDVDENFTAFNKEKANTGWVQNFSDGIGRFGIGAVTGPVQAVRLLGVANPIVRGLAWGGLTDFIQGAGSAKDEQTMLGELGKGLSSLTGVENEAWAKGVLSVFAKHETNSEITRRFKMALDGFVIGGAVDLVLTGLIRAVKKVPWRSMPKPDDMDVPQMSGQPDGGGDVAAALPAPVKVDDAVPVPEVQTRPATDLDPQGFFSAVSRAVDAIPMEKGSGSQMRAMIAKGEGVKAEEMAWTGLDDFLAGKKSVTKQEVRDYVDANQVRVEEVVKGKFGIPGEPKFGEYTLPGGENYREVLLKLPKKAMTFDEYAAEYKRRAPGIDDATIQERYADYEAAPGDDLSPDTFRGGHYDEPNVLAHIRLNDRTGPNGEKILFVEEIQSDWHQKGRKEGYKGGPRYAGKLSAKEMDGGIGWEITDENGTFVTNVLKTEGPGHIQFEPAGAGALERTTVVTADDALSVAQRRIDNPDVGSLPRDDRVPDAPLKKTWHEMSFRRVARMAAEEGYDAIAWTPGKVQIERYDLRKHLSEIQLSGGDFKAYGLDGETVIERTGVKPEDLPELIGKEAADRLMSQEPKAGLRSLIGEELEVGGEGMEGFYDQMLKKYVEKWGKKFGSKVGVSKIANDGPASVLEVVENEAHWMRNVTGESTFTVVDRTNGGQVADFRTQAEAQKYIENDLADTEVWTMPVTPKMRDSVLKKGVPLFSAAGAAAATGAAMQNEKQPASERVF